jgi:hypothetical protein
MQFYLFQCSITKNTVDMKISYYVGRCVVSKYNKLGAKQ